MNTISISNLKTNPAKAIRQSEDFPIAVKNRDNIKAYLIGKDLYEKLVTYVEELADEKAINDTDFTKGKDFEKLAKELGI